MTDGILSGLTSQTSGATSCGSDWILVGNFALPIQVTVRHFK